MFYSYPIDVVCRLSVMIDNRRGFLAPVAVGLCGLALFAGFGGCSRTPTQAGEGAGKSRSIKTDNSSGGVPGTAPKPAQTEIPTSVEPSTLPNQKFKVELAPGVPLEFASIPPGSFMMGNSTLGVRRHQEKIAKSFYLGQHEVTQEQWQAVMGNNPSLHQGPPKRPVERVNWDECQAFLQKLNEKFSNKTGMRFGLPTEAQWEWACRAGVALRIDSTDNPDKIEEYGWFGTNSALETHPVGERRPNRWGLYDMHGNVAEWCADNATNMADDQPADGTSAGEFHVVRGGSWRDAVREGASMSRVVRRGTVSLRFDGFRVMCEPKD